MYVDTTDTIDKKIAALLCHESQIPDPPGSTSASASGARMNGAAVGLPDGRTAEAFKAVDAA